MHARGDSLDEVRRVFGCTVEYQHGEIELRLSRHILDLPHRAGDSQLLDILRHYADSQIASLPGRGSTATRVSASIAREMSQALPTLLTTAADLHLSPRTLQRQLAHEGMSHSTVLDDVRRALAMKYIGDAALSVGEIGFLLHFGDSTAFHRAFKRWTGEGPAHYRHRLYGPPVDPEPARSGTSPGAAPPKGWGT
jgi:AraC-like DNA-binding protein